MNADRLEFYRNQLRGVPIHDLGRKMMEVLVEATNESARIERGSHAADVATLEQEARQVRARLARVEKERDELLASVVRAREALQFANDTPNGPICDTIWMMHEPETLFDFIDAAIEKAEGDRYEALEREHLGDPEKKTGIYAAKNASVFLNGEPLGVCEAHFPTLIHTGDGTPVEYCAECGRNEVVAVKFVESEGGEC